MHRPSQRELATQLGLSPYRVRKLLARFDYLPLRTAGLPGYDPRTLQLIRAMHDPNERRADWLTAYLNNGGHVSTPAGPGHRITDPAQLAALQRAGELTPDGVQSVHDEVEVPDFDPERLVYPGEMISLSTTLAVQLPDDVKESYFGAKHNAIVQPGEDYTSVGNRLLTTVNDLVVANVEHSITEIAAAMETLDKTIINPQTAGDTE